VNISAYYRLFPDDLDVASRVYDAWDVATGGEFWAAHLLRQGYDEDAVLSGFGIDEEAARARFEQLSDPDRWPIFCLPLDDGRALTAVYRNFGEDEGVDYLLETDDQCLRMSVLEGSFQGPGLSWGELRGLLQADGPVPAEARLLMFLPMSGEADTAEAARPVAAEALRQLGAAGDIDELADALTEDHPMWDLPQWERDAEGNLVCDGEYSPRNPHSPFYNRVPVALPIAQ
jgi:hypothetical protein